MLQNRFRLFQALGLGIVTTILVAPLGNQDSQWPRLSDQEREIEMALQEIEPPAPIVAQKSDTPAESSSSSSSSSANAVAAAPTAKKKTQTRRRSMVAEAPAPQEEEEEETQIQPTHYRLRDRDVMRQVARMERSYNDCDGAVEDCE